MKSIKKNFPLVLAILFTIFTLPMNGLTVLAEDKTYDDIKDGTHNIKAKATHADKDEASGAAGFLNEEAKLTIKDGKSQLVISVPHNDMASIEGIQIEGKEATVEEKDNYTNHTFNLSSLKKELNSKVQYAVPSLGMEHDVAFRFILEGLDELPVKESIPENEGTIINNPDQAEEVKYKSELDLSRYFQNPAKFIEKDGKKYIQMTGNMGQFIDSLIINGKKATLSEVKENGTYTMQFEITDSLSTNLDFKMVIDTGENGPGIMKHDTKLWFEEKTDEKPKTETKEETKTKEINFKTVEEKDSSLEKGKTKVKQKGKKGKKEVIYEVTFIDGQEEKRTIKKESVITKPVEEIILIGTKNTEKTTIKDGTYDIKAKAMHETKNELSGAAGFINEDAKLIIKDGKFKLRIAVPDDDLASVDGIQIEGKNAKVKKEKNITYYTFSLKELKEELPSRVQYSVPSINLEHDVPFRFVLEDLEKLPKDVQGNITDSTNDNTNSNNNNNNNNNDNEKPKKVNVDDNADELTPDKAYKINYTIKHENGIKNSVANDFFKKPGKLLEKDGVLYAQFTITNGDMVKQLSTEFGDVLIVKKQKDGSIVVQFKVNKDLSNMNLSMFIDVPGLYTESHKAILVFDKSSKTEIDANKEKLIASNSENGPTVTGSNEGKTLGKTDNQDELTNLSNNLPGPTKPEFGSNNNKDKNQDKSKNPQTGDLTNIWLYAFLLAGSMLILGIKFRRRTI